MRKIKVFFVIAVLLTLVYPVLYMGTSGEIVIQIEDKERITTGSGEDLESKFLVYSDIEVLENTDTWLFFKFNSADIQGELKKDSAYVVKVAGWRVPFLSMYRNIISIEKYVGSNPQIEVVK